MTMIELLLCSCFPVYPAGGSSPMRGFTTMAPIDVCQFGTEHNNLLTFNSPRATPSLTKPTSEASEKGGLIAAKVIFLV